MTFPSDANGDALRRMKDQGDDLTLPRRIEYTVVFPNQNSALSFAQYIGTLGYDVSLDFSETVEGLPWEVIVVKHMVPSHDGIREFEIVLQTAADPLEGRNDGWGCFSEPSEEL